MRVSGQLNCSKSSEQFSISSFLIKQPNEGCSVAFEWDRPMCDKCVEFDKTIERYRRILLSIGDQVTIDRTKELIAELLARKAALHPEQHE
jgi:hypothetical protein